MPKYVWTAKHTFKSENNLKKHLKRDEKHFLKILDKLKKTGMMGAHRGVINNNKNKFSHIGFLLFKNKKSYKKSMQIIKNAEWDKKIPKRNRYETFLIDKEIN